MPRVQHIKANRAALVAKATAGLLLPGEIYLIKDDSPKTLAIATSTTTFDEYYNKNKILGELSTKEEKTTFYSSNNLIIDGAVYNFFNCIVSADETFSLSNIISGVFYYILITNSGNSSITVTLPTVDTLRANPSYIIDPTKSREFAVIYTGSKYVWQVSEHLV